MSISEPVNLGTERSLISSADFCSLVVFEDDGVYRFPRGGIRGPPESRLPVFGYKIPELFIFIKVGSKTNNMGKIY